MATYEKEVIKLLQNNGCTFKRKGKGDHSVWYSPITNRIVSVDGKIKSRDTANAILKDAGINHKL